MFYFALASSLKEIFYFPLSFFDVLTSFKNEKNHLKHFIKLPICHSFFHILFLSTVHIIHHHVYLTAD